MSDIQLHMDSKPLQRSSNIELYRIIVMFLIVAHHFVVNSGMTAENMPLVTNPFSASSIFLWIFGMWGKIGINCFVMITGYFMSKSRITLRKFLKLLLWVYFYKIVIYALFVSFGKEDLGITRLIQVVMPVWNFESNFVECYLVFFLTIPFWNILINNMSRLQHGSLILLAVVVYSILGNIPGFEVRFNYITWFGIIYLIASFLRIYPVKISSRQWQLLCVCSILLAIGSVLILNKLQLYVGAYAMVVDSNKILPVLCAVTSFMVFKNWNLPYNKFVNKVALSVFGVILIHGNSDAMRQWLWHDVFDVMGYGKALGGVFPMVLYSFGVTILVFSVCIIIDMVRLRFIEKPLFRYLDKKFDFLTDKYIISWQ